MSLVPNSRPQMKQSDVEKILKSKGIDRDKYPVAVLAVRGYYRDTMGKPGENDRGIFDDASFVHSPTIFASVNWNTDPSGYRKGSGNGSAKGMAVLNPGVWLYKIGLHKGKGPACRQAGDVTVTRDGVNGPYEDTGDFAINHHWGKVSSTSSAGCQTAPLNQWDSYILPLQAELKRYKQTNFPYVLITEEERVSLLAEAPTDPEPPKVVPNPFEPVKPPIKPGVPLDFYDLKLALKNNMGTAFKDDQFQGYQTIIGEYYRLGYTRLDWLAYLLATAYHETNATMRPVVEAYWLSEAWRAKNLRYYPFHGRGYVQLTWETNYEKYGISKTPEKALEPDFAAYVLIDGSVKGLFTGKKLSNYFTDKAQDPVAARKIINGTDKAELIAGYYRSILRSLTHAVVS